ncbi:MAG: hypothetical protein Ct9H300mP29_1120 [Candidatus Neomarinimicrobiota bacterium]|nr:MAG: hypothetical protein Ct9H300mP29_1120 [Candidatus Neomarinimicrobiota bacterium]
MHSQSFSISLAILAEPTSGANTTEVSGSSPKLLIAPAKPSDYINDQMV